MTPRSQSAAILGTTTLVSAGIFGRLIYLDPILARDDQNILAHLHGLSDLISLLKRGHFSEIIAYQPVRDLSYFFDLSVQKYLGLSSFHFTNFVIWVAIILSIYSLLKTLYQENPLALEFTVLIAFHPIFVDSVGWISARKHLLSCLFILLATRLVIGLQKNNERVALNILGIFFLYCLSILSQPINILWPVWMVFYLLSTPREARGAQVASRTDVFWVALACAPLLITGGIANLYYYSKLYPLHTSALRWANSSAEYGTPFLAVGRYFYNFFIPGHLALIYYPGSWQNLAGLILFIGFLLFISLFQKIRFQSWGVWAAFFIFPLFPVIVKATNIFVSDTYLLIGAFGLINLIILSVGSIWKRSRPTYLIILFVFAFLSFRQATNWETDRALWTSSYAAEPAPRSLAFNIKYLIEEKRYSEATEEALLLQSWDPDQEELPLLFAQSVYFNPSIGEEQKISQLESQKGKPWINYYLASLYAKEQRFTEAFALMKEAIGIKNSSHVFGDDFSVVSAEAHYFCLKSHDSKAVPECNDWISEVKKARYWDEKAYSERFHALAGQ